MVFQVHHLQAPGFLHPGEDTMCLFPSASVSGTTQACAVVLFGCCQQDRAWFWLLIRDRSLWLCLSRSGRFLLVLYNYPHEWLASSWCVGHLRMAPAVLLPHLLTLQKLMVFSTPKHPEFRVWSISLFNCQTRSASLRFAFCRSCGVQPFFSFFFFNIYLSALQVLVAAHGIFRCGTWAQWLGHIGSLVEVHELSSCGTWA